MKKKVLSFVLAICFMIPCVFMLAGCGAADCLVWDNTFAYQGEMRYQADSWDRDTHPYAKIEDFLNSRVDDIDWDDSSMDYSSKDWKTGREILNGLKKELDLYYTAIMDIDEWEITFSSKEEGTVIFNNGFEQQTYYLKPNTTGLEGFLDAYSIPEGQMGHEESRVMSFREKCSGGNFELTFFYSGDSGLVQSFDFVFSTPYTKHNKEEAYQWAVDFYPYFGRVEKN